MEPPSPEFSRIISVSRISAQGLPLKLEAKPAERRALAERFDLLDLTVLKAEVLLETAGQEVIDVKGFLEADYIQSCVITLEPLPTHVKHDIRIRFLPQRDEIHSDDDSELVDASDDETEFYSGGKIDLGEIIAQYFGITIDPYPRCPGAALPDLSTHAPTGRPQPLSKLVDILKESKKTD